MKNNITAAIAANNFIKLFLLTPGTESPGCQLSYDIA